MERTSPSLRVVPGPCVAVGFDRASSFGHCSVALISFCCGIGTPAVFVHLACTTLMLSRILVVSGSRLVGYQPTTPPYAEYAYLLGGGLSIRMVQCF